METTWAGRLRNRVFTPDHSEVTMAKRGFPVTDPQRRANLENVGSTFLEGFEYGIAGRTIPEIESSLEPIDRQVRGFAYEGCTMALAVRDALRPVRPHWVRDFLAGRGAAHIYMAYIGVGWAMARLPRMRWRAVMPADPLLRWLALDGYGFHQAYFRTTEYVREQRRDSLPLWAPASYAGRALDQGIGRALWFVTGSDAEQTAATIGRFAPDRRGDLWSGAALASVYAGGVGADDLKQLAAAAGEYRTHAAQGAAFAAKARLLAGLVIPHTEVGARVYCGMSVEEAAAVCDRAREGLPPDTGQAPPSFEIWRERIRGQLE
jgi:hypothetical protein